MKTRNLFLILAIACMGLSISACKKTTDENNLQTITVGGLLSKTGNWSTLGITSEAAMNIAVEDINKYLEQSASKYRLAVQTFDTKLDPILATQYLSQSHAKGYKFVIGPQSSAEAAAVKAYADSSDILVISQSSTAGSLSIAGDHLLRFCPDDKLEGAAMAKTIYGQGVRGLVTVARDDAGNKGLQSSVGNAFAALGGEVDAKPVYAVDQTDFTALLADIKAQVQAYTAVHGASGTGVYLASFDEFVQIFEQAAQDPELSSVKWYGGDGVVHSAALTASPAASGFAVATNYFAPAFGLPQQAQSKWMPVAQEIQARTGLSADAFALATYDAMWVIAKTYSSMNTYQPTFETLTERFLAEADLYYGVTGSTLLNEAGDRAIGSFDYWGIEKQNGNYVWVLKGRSE